MMQCNGQRWLTVLVAFLVATAVTGCKREGAPSAPGPGSGEMTAVGKLPAEFYGVWVFVDSSGGIDGQGNRGYGVEKIVIREGNIIEEHRTGGKVTRDTFSPGRGKSIFSTGEVWNIRRKNNPMIEVVSLATNGVLTISENVYDGFSYSFKRL